MHAGDRWLGPAASTPPFVAVKPEEFFNQYLSQDGNLAQHFVQTILLFPPNFAMGLTVDLIDGCSPELLNEGIEQIGQMIEKLFSWQIIRGRNFSVATHPTKPFGGDFLAPLIKEVCEGGYVVRHNRMMRPGGRARRGGCVGKADWEGREVCKWVF